MSASAAVTFISFVGGLKPKIPIRFAIPRYISTDARYAAYCFPSDPRIPSVIPSSEVTACSRRSCLLLGFSTLSFLVRSNDRTSTAAIMIQVTTTDSEIPIPPIVKALSQFISSLSASPKLPIFALPFFFSSVPL